MKRSELRQLILEAINENEYSDLIDSIKKIITKYFPTSTSEVYYEKGIGDGYIYVNFLIGKKSDWFNGYPQNSPVKISGLVYIEKNGFEWNPQAASILIKPVKNEHLAYERVKLPARKIKGDESKILTGFDRLFSKSKSIIKQTIPQMKSEHQWVTKYV